MIPRLAQGAAQYRNRLADRVRENEGAVVACPVAVVVAGAALADGGYSAGAAAAIGAGCWWLVFALLALRLAPLEAVPRWALLAGGALFAFAAFTLLSIAWADDDGSAYRAAVLAFLYAGVFALVVISCRRGSIRSWLTGLAIGLGAVCLLALATRWFPGLRHDDVTSALPDAKGRLSYPIGYWNALGCALALLTALLGWLAGSARTSTGRAAATGLLVLPTLGIFLTSSRGAVVAGVVGLLVLLATAEKRTYLLVSLAIAAPGCAAVILVADAQGTISGSEGTLLLAITAGCALLVAAVRRGLDAGLERVAVPRAIGAVAAAAAVVAVAIGAIAANPSERWDNFKSLPAPTTSSSDFVTSHLASGTGSGRYQFWSAALDAFDEKPARGIGAGGFEAWWTQRGEFSYRVKNAHSLFFETLAELGLIGLILILGFFATTAIAGIARLGIGPRSEVGAALAVMAAGIVSAAIDWTWQLPAAFAGVVIAAALLTGAASLPTGSPEADAEDRPRRRSPWRVLGMAASLLVTVACGIQLLSSIELDRSQSEIRNGNLGSAADAARAASAIEPWSGAAYLQLALVQEQAGDLTGAIDSVRDATDHDSEDWSVWLVRARLEAKRGNVRAAKAALARSRDLNPRSPVFTLLPSRP
jgi:hypothetical protein